MEEIIKLAEAAFAGAIALFAVLLLAKPLYDEFVPSPVGEGRPDQALVLPRPDICLEERFKGIS